MYTCCKICFRSESFDKLFLFFDFFLLFIVLTIFCRKIAETFVLPAAVAAWVPCSVLFPIGIFLTIKAMNDNKLVNPDRFVALFHKIAKYRKP